MSMVGIRNARGSLAGQEDYRNWKRQEGPFAVRMEQRYAEYDYPPTDPGGVDAIVDQVQAGQRIQPATTSHGGYGVRVWSAPADSACANEGLHPVGVFLPDHKSRQPRPGSGLPTAFGGLPAGESADDWYFYFTAQIGLFSSTRLGGAASGATVQSLINKIGRSESISFLLDCYEGSAVLTCKSGSLFADGSPSGNVAPWPIVRVTTKQMVQRANEPPKSSDSRTLLDLRSRAGFQAQERKVRKITVPPQTQVGISCGFTYSTPNVLGTHGCLLDEDKLTEMRVSAMRYNEGAFIDTTYPQTAIGFSLQGYGRWSPDAKKFSRS